ncbi:TPA: hypothetical protein I7730_00450 [Vibrio vulnificus]|uniref:Uncharacterized protein n=1 Tax=Vibrio vulnificus TaxID=672 RepID=A0A8H9K5L6_VIBVL|nr:hypothetical protein [Vibrio vulnificus]
MKNRHFKISQHDLYANLYSRHISSGDKIRQVWAFDRLRLFEQNMNRTKIRHPEVSKVSVSGGEHQKIVKGLLNHDRFKA